MISIVRYVFHVDLAHISAVRTVTHRRLLAKVQANPLYLAVPLAISVFFGCITLLVLGIKTDSLILILAEQGQLLKDEAPANLSLWGKLLPLGPVHMAIIWWFAYRLRHAEMSVPVRRWMNLLLYFAIFVAVANTVARVDRTALMPILVGMLPIYIFTNPRKRSSDLWPVIRPLIVGAAVILGMFCLLSLLRGNTYAGTAGQLLLGYTFSSYNRLATVLNGSLHYYFTGNVEDLCWFCSSNKYFNAVVPYASYFRIPDPITSWSMDFMATDSAGLVGGYTFASAFALVFRDIGWWTPVYFAFQGVVVGKAWQSFRKGNVLGLMLYPWCAFSVLFWFGWNVFLTDPFFYICAGAIAIGLYEKWIMATLPDGFTQATQRSLRDSVSDLGGD